MTQAAIKKLVDDSVSAALEAQAANMANTDNTTRPREAPVERKCSYKEFMSCQPINFKGTKGVVGLICWFEQTESVFSRSNCTEDCKVKFATGICEKIPGIGNLMSHYGDSEKIIEVFIGGLPQSIEGNVTASKPQNLDVAINIAQKGGTNGMTGATLTLLVVIGMDWLSKYHARIICDEKVIHIPINGETLIIRVMEKKSDGEKKYKISTVVRDFPEFFCRSTWLHPVRQVRNSKSI
ncbi:hypothetical protein Tco_0979205 [Tanacetum coccineum]